VSSSGGVLTHSASVSGLNLSAKFSSVGSAIKVDTTLTSTTGTDRPVELSFRLPLNIPGWIWDNDLVTPMPIVSGTRYENLNTGFGPQNHSIYPFATVRNSSSALSLAVPLVPQMNRFGYDTKYGLRCTWDLGLSPAATKTPNKATLSFWIYSSTPKWGMRAAAEKYYALNPASFTSNAPIDKGAWVLLGPDNTLTSIPNSQDFGWGYNDGYGNIDFANDKGLLALHYVDPSGWFRRFPTYQGGPQPPYSVLVDTLNTEATSGTGGTTDGIPVKEMAQAVKNSSPYNEAGLYQFSAKAYFWYKNTFQIYPVFADPDIPAPSMHSVIKKYSVDGRIAMAAGSGNHLDGIFLDDVALVSNLENHRRALWAHSSSPPSFSYATRKVTLWGGFTTAEFLQSLRAYLHSKSLTLGGSIGGGNLWFAPHLDIVGGEVRGYEALDRAYGRRTMGYGKLWSNLLVPVDDLPASAATVLAYMRQALSLGYFPGFNNDYWRSSTAYERDRPLFKKYIPLIKKVAAAGWKPVPYATSSDPKVFIERFDNQTGNVFYLTAHNSSTATTSASFTLDGAALGIASSDSVAVKELLSNASIPASRAGANVTLSDSLDPGETTLYEFTVSESLPKLSISDVSLTEGDSGTKSFVFTVSLSPASAQAVTVNYATAGSSASSGTDFQAASGTLTFSAGQTSKTVTVLVNGDTANEPNEIFMVNLSGPANATLQDSQGAGTILNDDGAEIDAISPGCGPASGGTRVTITGAGFVSGATVKIGTAPASGVTVASSTRIDATTATLAAGTLQDIVVTNPDLLTGTLVKAFLVDFLDVTGSHMFHGFVDKMLRNGITAGCGAGKYCPDGTVSRAQMAVFLLKAKHGASYLPPAATGTVFDDVPASAFAAAWIERLEAEGITTGCGGGLYCPDGAVTRDEMSILLLKAKHGTSYLPPPADGLFGDVPVSDPLAPWIEQLAAEGITAGCGGGNFCPDSVNTRGQMAVFLGKTFALP
jgi:hypothetical protein